MPRPFFHASRMTRWSTVVLLLGGGLASLLVSVLGSNAAAGANLQQLVIVPITRNPDVVAMEANEDAGQPRVRWQSPAGALLPDDMVDPPEKTADADEAQSASMAANGMDQDVAPLPPPTTAPIAVAAVTPPPAPTISPSPARHHYWQQNAVPVSDSVQHSGRPKIAVIIDDVGLNKSRAMRTLQLPAPLTLSFLPYADDLPSMTTEAHRHGHELMVHIPMEAMDPDEDPGPGALRIEQGPTENLALLRNNLSKFDGYVGLNNHMGSRFTSDAASITPILEVVRDRGLLFIDSVTSAKSVAGHIADRMGIPNASRQVFLDDDQSPGSVRQSLTLLEHIARRNGMAIAIGHPHPVTLSLLEQWLPDVQARGFDLVPVSYIVNARKDQWQPAQIAEAPAE